MTKFLEWIFVVFLVLSLTIALVLVGVQLFGIAIADGALTIKINKLLLTPTIVCSAIFGTSAFLLGYTDKYKGAKGD